MTTFTIIKQNVVLLQLEKLRLYNYNSIEY